jgi:hypothetical protein
MVVAVRQPPPLTVVAKDDVPESRLKLLLFEMNVEADSRPLAIDGSEKVIDLFERARILAMLERFARLREVHSSFFG